MAIQLNNFKTRIYEYVGSRMTFIAPNLSAIVGASRAAKLLGIAGGLTKLSKMPSCNFQVLASQRKTLSDFFKTQSLPHTGYTYVFCANCSRHGTGKILFVYQEFVWVITEFVCVLSHNFLR